MKTINKTLITLAAVSGLVLSGAALADRDDIRMLDETKITLIDAIQIAEAHQGGQAFEAKLDDDSFTPEFEVELVHEGRIYELTIDGVSGEVRRVKEDQDD